MLPAPLILTVSQLTATVKEILETGFTDLVIEGEISGLRSTTGKHLYFSLKDDKALLKVVWFSWASRPGAIPPQDGERVRVWGRLTVYEAQGQYQLVISRLEAIGLGDILARLERLKRQLDAEGLFAPEKRRPIPPYPAVIGLVTSESGAALQDMLRIFLQNKVPTTVRIFPVPVQGQESPSKIVRALDLAGSLKLADVLVLARGGGSTEDLLGFSDEAVVRSVARCPVPVISAIGHETDSPLTDWAADLRAPTPTAAAEYLARPWFALEQTLKNRRSEMFQAIERRLERIRAVAADFRPERLEETFRRLIHPRYQRLDDLKEYLLASWKDRINHYQNRVTLAQASITALSPLAVLDRGWALVSDLDGRTISGIDGLGLGQNLEVRWKNGHARVEIKEIGP